MELLAATAEDGAVSDGVWLSADGLRALQKVLAPAVASLGPARSKGEAAADGVRCIVERRPGEDLAVTTPEGTFVLHELALTVLRTDEP